MVCSKIDFWVGPQALGVIWLGADSATSHDHTPLEPGNEARHSPSDGLPNAMTKVDTRLHMRCPMKCCRRVRSPQSHIKPPSRAIRLLYRQAYTRCSARGRIYPRCRPGRIVVGYVHESTAAWDVWDPESNEARTQMFLT